MPCEPSAARTTTCGSRNVFRFFSKFPKCWNPSRSWNTAAEATGANCAWQRLGHGMAATLCRSTAAWQEQSHKEYFCAAKPLWVLGQSPTSSRSHKPFIPHPRHPHHRTASQCPCSCNGTSTIRIARATVSTNIFCNQAQRMFFSYNQTIYLLKFLCQAAIVR